MWCAAELDARRTAGAQVLALERRADVDDPDRDAIVAEDRRETLAMTEPVLDREDRAVLREHALRRLGRPGGALRFRRDDRDVDRLVVAIQRGLRPVEAGDGHPAIEGPRDERPDRAEAEDRYAHQPTFFGLNDSSSAARSLSFIGKLCSASGNRPPRTSASKRLRASTTIGPSSA